MEQTMEEITVQELKQKMESNEEFLLLDVRESHEYHLSNINGTLIPLDQLPARLDEIKEFMNKEVVVMCRSGARSARACMFLTANGFASAKNLRGGINDWARQIDPTLPVY